MIKPKKNIPSWIIVHHTASNNSFEIDNDWHKKKWPQFISELGFHIGYHYWIDKNGEIKQARREDKEAAHCIGLNIKSIGIALQGNFSNDGEYPTNEQKISLKKLLIEIMKRYNIPATKIVPHRYFSKTECYGKNLSNDMARQLVIKDLQNSDDKQDIELLKKKITILENLVRIYIKLIALIRKSNN